METKAEVVGKKRGRPRRGPGRPAHKPLAVMLRSVEAMAAYGIPASRIAVCMGISEQTLHKHYAAELSGAQTRMISEVAANYVRMALLTDGGAVAERAARFILERRGGWVDPRPWEMVRETDRAPAAPVVGKKEERARLAEEIATTPAEDGWGTLLMGVAANVRQ